MPTSAETRFKQGYREQVLLPLSISSENRTFVSTPTAMSNTAAPADSFHADRQLGYIAYYLDPDQQLLQEFNVPEQNSA